MFAQRVNLRVQYGDMIQLDAIQAVKEGHNVCLLGGPGTGKTWVIKNVTKSLRQEGKVVCVTASTGIAALNLACVNASTIHKLTGNCTTQILLVSFLIFLI